MRPVLLFILLISSATLNARTSCDPLKVLSGPMLDQYDALSVENEQISAEMNVQRARVDSLRSALNRGSYDLDAARKEAKVLRNIMTGYVVTIGPLNSVNGGSQHTIDEQNGQGK